MNKREKGLDYRVKTLIFLARAGYATTRQIAKAVWGRCNESTRKMAGRTLRWLLEEKYIVTKRDGNSINNEQLSAVTAAGAAWLAEYGKPLPQGKAHARDWLRHAHSHRTSCNSVFASLWEGSTAAVYSELEIRAGIAPMNKFEYTFDGKKTIKVPDIIVKTAAGFEWIEIENTWRSEKDLEKMVVCMRQMFDNPRNKVACIHFIITAPGAKTIGKRIEKALTHGPQSGWPRQVKELDGRILAGHIKVSQLNAENLTLH